MLNYKEVQRNRRRQSEKEAEWVRGRMRKRLNKKETEWDWVCEKKTDWDREVGKSSKKPWNNNWPLIWTRDSLWVQYIVWKVQCLHDSNEKKKYNKKVRRFPSLSDQLNKENIGLES